jgi:hypothetical protein
MNVHRNRIASACAGVLVASALAAVPAVADSGDGAPQLRKTTCETVTVHPAAFCRSSKRNVTQVTYYDKDDKIKILDKYNNGRWTKAVVHVKGHSVKKFSSKGKKNRVVKGHYPEDRSIRVKVCTSWTKKAKCSDWSRYFAT